MRKIAFLLVAASLLASGCVNRAAQQQAKRTEAQVSDPVRVVKTQPVATSDLTETLEITGQVTTSDDAQIGAKINGRLVAVYVKDGDRVSAGQVIAVQETTTAMAQYRAALGQVRAAQAQLSQALSNQTLSPARSRASVATAEAQVRAARAQLAKAIAGARPEERRQVDAQVRSAKTNVETAQKTLERARTLVEQGAIARSQLDAAQNGYSAALAQYESALESQRLVSIGARSEDLEVAREAVRQAESQLQAARATQSLDVTLSQQVQAARASVQSAQAQADVAKQALEDAQIRAPFAGKIAGRPLQVGTVIGPGTPVARLVGGEGTYFDGEVSETSVARIQVGVPVRVTLAALPDRTLEGRVAAISPLGSGVGRLFNVRIALQGETAEVRPGMFAQGLVTLRTIRDAVVIPANAIVRQEGRDVVFVKQGDVAKRLPVQTGLRSGERVQVSGLEIGLDLIVEGQTLVSDGTKIRIDAPPSAPASGAADAAKGN